LFFLAEANSERRLRRSAVKGALPVTILPTKIVAQRMSSFIVLSSFTSSIPNQPSRVCFFFADWRAICAFVKAYAKKDLKTNAETGRKLFFSYLVGRRRKFELSSALKVYFRITDAETEETEKSRQNLRAGSLLGVAGFFASSKVWFWLIILR